jgi:BASS family bile acid:Na+ symporter
MTSARHTAVLIEHTIGRHLIWIIAISYLAAGVWPASGLWLRGLELGNTSVFQIRLSFPLPSVMLALLLLNGGLGVKTAELKHLLRKPLVLLGGGIGNLLTPLAFILVISFMMRLWPNPRETERIITGLALVAAMPIAGASAAWSQNANGNLALSLGLVLLTTALSPLLTPFVLHFGGALASGDYSEDLHELASGAAVSFLGTWIVLPSCLGILARSLLGDGRVSVIMPYVKLMNYCVLALLNYSNAALALPRVLSQPDLAFIAVTLAIVIALCAAAFTSGFILARICKTDRGEMASLMFGLGMNNNGAGLVLASLELADHPGVMLPVIFYNLIQHLVASLVDFSIFRRQPA